MQGTSWCQCHTGSGTSSKEPTTRATTSSPVSSPTLCKTNEAVHHTHTHTHKHTHTHTHIHTHTHTRPWQQHTQQAPAWRVPLGFCLSVCEVKLLMPVAESSFFSTYTHAHTHAHTCIHIYSFISPPSCSCCSPWCQSTKRERTPRFRQGTPSFCVDKLTKLRKLDTLRVDTLRVA
jgi:hypothetical protein